MTTAVVRLCFVIVWGPLRICLVEQFAKSCLCLGDGPRLGAAHELVLRRISQSYGHKSHNRGQAHRQILLAGGGPSAAIRLNPYGHCSA
jgi:hypothetical protein